ncbi:type I DNA topoisomerase [Patescibacteria group bacterium]|nr:type I DNA topoisomerase [Patescibacteria group bacterium]
MSKLLIVESPTKAKTIKKILGREYEVISSFGHIRDLPKKEMGIDFENDFEAKYVVPTDKKSKVKALKDLAKKVDEIYLATDGDREGEAIAWHIAQILKLKPEEEHRIIFHEITKHAIEKALEHPGKIEQDLVEAQQTRRILDRIVGYELSPFLWKKIRRGLSAGRVQSVAVRLIVDREREREAFKTDEYWTVDGMFEKDSHEFEGKLTHRDGKKLKKLDIKNGDDAKSIVDSLQSSPFVITATSKKEAKKQPPTPLTTSSLQQEANNKLHYSAKQTMRAAQKLYETGHITYMRTDSLNLAEKFLGEAQEYIKSEFGTEYAKGPRTYKTKSKGAQEAHEAIRPTDVTATPEVLKGKLDDDICKLYNLIWRRTVATQLPEAKIERTAIDLSANNHTFRANGSIIIFDGFMRVYRSAKETLLPDLKENDSVDAKSIEAKQHFTEPPARFSDATLVKTLEEYEVGRPSTYAPTISTIIDRGYVDRDDNKKLFPTDTGKLVNDVLVEHFPNIVDFDFTAKMEDSLDKIADGKNQSVPMLKDFYGPFHANVQEKTKTLDKSDIVPDKQLGTDPKTGKTVYIKTGRFGSYVQLGEFDKENKEAEKPKSSSLSPGMKFDDVTLEIALELLKLPRELGKSKDGDIITVQIGRYGAYLKAGKTNVTLPPEFEPLTITPEQAKDVFDNAAEYKKKMNEPLAELGKDLTSGEDIVIKNGRYGPYVTDGKTNASVPKNIDPKTITKEDAEALLAKKRKA